MKILLLTFLTVTCLNAESTPSGTMNLPIENIVAKGQQILEKNQIVGISMTIFDENGIVASQGFGYADRSLKVPISPSESRFRINSVSKLFTTVAIAKLAEQGILDLEGSILDLKKVGFIDFLLAHERPDRLASWRKIKIKHLLLHQAGISKDLPGSRVFWNSSAIADHALPSKEALYQGLLQVEFIYPAGETEGAIKYSNLGMNLLARIVEDLNSDGLNFAAYMKNYVFEPLGMSNSVYNIAANTNRNMVVGYGTKQLDGAYIELPQIYDVASYDGSIGIAATTDDLALFGQHLLKASLFQANKLFVSPESAEYFLTPPDMNTVVSPGRIMGPGFFWRYRPVADKKSQNLWVGHTGAGYGFESILLVNPARKLGVAVTANTLDKTYPAFELWDFIATEIAAMDSDSANEKTQKLLDDIVVKLEKADSGIGFSQIAGQDATETALRKFVGSYFADNAAEGVLKKVILKEDKLGRPQLYFSFGEGAMEFNLTPTDLSNGVFRMDKMVDVLFNGERFEFLFDSYGRVTGFILAQVKEFQRVN